MLVIGGTIFGLLTAAAGLCRTYWQLFTVRLGVGVGEATCVPAATSLIGDLYPAERRAKAVAIFMSGPPLGIALSYAAGGAIARAYGWRAAFYVAGILGAACAATALFLVEPRRGAAEAHAIGGLRRKGSPYLVVLSVPTMCWIMASGALHNFNMYAVASFLSPFLMRFHGLDVQWAGFVAMVVFGLAGIPGMAAGGIAGDAIIRRRPAGRLWLSGIAILISIPLIYFALGQARGHVAGFLVLMGLGSTMMYTYHSLVYSTIHDVIEPSLRGTAMALYYFAMYVLGGSFGSVGVGLASDYFTARAARGAGVTSLTVEALEPFRAAGLHSAMYIVPALAVLVAVVLFAGARTLPGDVEKLHRWMREAAARVQPART